MTCLWVTDSAPARQRIWATCRRSSRIGYRAWWVYRMLFGPDPLAERLALLWHSHFATSNLKVENLTFMRQQNELFRALGRRPFGELLSLFVPMKRQTRSRHIFRSPPELLKLQGHCLSSVTRNPRTAA